MRSTTGNIGWIAVLAGLWGAQVWAQQPSAPTTVYTCVDRNGRKITADRPIADCIDREQRVLDQTGAERRRIGPSLTEHERAAIDAQRRKEAEARIRAAEERRRERALIARYPDKAAHDIERATALQQVDDVTAVAQKRIDELVRDRKKYDTEMDFYRKDPSKAPMTLRRQIAEQEDAVAEQQRFIANQEQEKRRVHQRFDTELAQLRQLWAAQQATAAGLMVAPSASTAAPAAAGGPAR